MITYPLNKIDYQATDAELFHCTRNSGIYASDDFVCTVTGADNNVTIGAGIGWIRNSKFSGKVIANKSDVVLDLGLADATLNRWDIVAIQFNKNNNATDLVVKHGTLASTPVRPEIVQTETLYELYLAAFYRKAGATTITASDVYDLRLDPTVCGLMADSVTQIDTTGINAQINALIEELRKEIAGVESSAEIMLKSVYDTDGDGVVDKAKMAENAVNAEKLNGQPASYYATKTEVETAQTTADNAISRLDNMGKELKWTNASLQSEFQSQSLHISGVNYTKPVYILFRYQANSADDNTFPCFMEKIMPQELFCTYKAYMTVNIRREIRLNTNNNCIDFGIAQHRVFNSDTDEWKENNLFLLPYKIYQ